MAGDVAAALGCEPKQVLVASTGVIGVNLKMDSVVAGIRSAVAALARGKGSETARAIMTTDPFPKEHAVTVQTRARLVHGRRHGEGLRHDRAEHGDDARASSRPTRGCRRRCSHRALRRVGARHVQRHHRRRRVLDQRLAVRAGVRRQRRRHRRRDSIRRCSRRCSRCRASWRSASSAAARARPS